MDVDLKLLFPVEKLILTFAAACWPFEMEKQLGLSLFGLQQQQQKKKNRGMKKWNDNLPTERLDSNYYL